ncbi:MAG TPA: cell wall-binding repeat-containing protein [Acidimicrobiales bacterium]|nr:cell wall-binding repeat-containing protein [Acidimicrobiales bacterium]
MESKGLVGRVLSTTAAVTVSAVVISGVGGLVAAAPAFAAGATVGAPTPNKGAAGTSVKITESHFAANSALTISMNGTPASITSGGTTSATGAATTTLNVPSGLAAGNYPIKVTDAAGNTASSSNFAVQAAKAGPCETLLYYSGTAPAPTAGTAMTLYYDDDSAVTSAAYSVDGGQSFTPITPAASTVSSLTALDTCGGSVSKTTQHESALTFTPSGSGPLVVTVTDGDGDSDSYTWSSVSSANPATPLPGSLTAQLSSAGPLTTPTAVTDRATFTGTNGDAATGASISFFVCQLNGPCSSGSGTPEGSSPGATATSLSFTPPAPAAGSSATWCFSAYYSGNAHYTGADDNGTTSDPGQCFTISTAAAGSSGSSGSSNPPTPGGGTSSTGGSSTDGSGGSAGGAQGAGVFRVGGTDRIHTAILTSQADYSDGTAGAVILARSDLFPDSLAAAPLAVNTTAPILLTAPTSLDARTAAEITRVLLPGGTVYLLGQTAALSTDVENAVTKMGYTVDRIGGADRFATAADIASSIGSVTKVLLADGTNFPDAVSAAAACGPAGTVIALTDGTTMPGATTDFLTSHSGAPVVAVGGPAANAYPSATTKLVGADRYGTSVMVAQAFFSNPTGAGMATGLDFPDALTAGPYLAAGWPMLLTDPQSIPAVVSQYLNSIKPGMSAGIVIFGGPAAVSDSAMQQAKTLLGVS